MEADNTPPPLPVRIRLQAVDHARNIARDYEINAAVDLFGYWIVSLKWGRIGSKGITRSCSFSDQRAATRFIKSAITRRASARRRFGVAYRSVG